MNKNLVLAVCAAIVAAAAVFGLKSSMLAMSSEMIFNANVEALAKSESGVTGHCSEETGECMAICPRCGEKYYAPGHKGGSYNMSGQCDSCKGGM